MAQVSPYCLSAQVGLLFPHLLKGGADFADGQTTPSKTQVDTYINWISAQIERTFQSAGYVIPFEDLDDEDWPASQTQYLQLLCVTGVAGMIAGPTVSNPNRRGDQKNIFKQEFDAELLQVWDPRSRRSQTRFRASYYADTEAESQLKGRAGPTSDYMEGHYNPMQHESLKAMTEKVESMQKVFEYLDVPWDYLYSLGDFDTGVGEWATI